MATSEFARRLVEAAVGEHAVYAGISESDPRLKGRIVGTYLRDLRAADPGDRSWWDVSNDPSTWAWSATFVSWCVLTAGATTAQFDFSIRHAVFVKKAIAEAGSGDGAFEAHRIERFAPRPGDLIHANREGGTIDFDEAAVRDNYPSHSAVVVEIIRKEGNSYAVTIGGNESDSVRRTEVPLTSDGRVKQRAANPYVCVIACPDDVVGTPMVLSPPPVMPEQPSQGARASVSVGSGPLSAAFRRHGTFVYDVEATIADYGSVDDTVAAMLRAGMSHAWVRIHGQQPHSKARKAATAKLVAACRAAGVAIAGWGWCQGADPKAEAQLAIRESDALGLEDYVADIEPGTNNAQWTTSEIDTFFTTLRQKVKGSVAVSSYGLIDWHEPYIQKAALPFVDALAPQIYWFGFPNTKMLKEFSPPGGGSYVSGDPASYADLCLDRWARLAIASPKALVMTGQAYWGEGIEESAADAKLRSFLANWSGYGRLAGLNWWHFGGAQGMSHAMIEALVAADLDNRSWA